MARKKKIPAKTTLRLLDAVAFMNRHHGVAFNGMITLNFRQIGIKSEVEAKAALIKLNEALADKLARYGRKWSYDLPHYFLYVHEDVRSHGHHVHQLVVVPRGLRAELDGWLKEWARRNYGPDVHPNAIEYGGEYPRDAADRAKVQARLLKYVLKSSGNETIQGLDGEATTLLDVLHDPHNADRYQRAYCAAVRRVAGTSQNIGRRERLWGDFAKLVAPESALSDRHLNDWRRAQNLDAMLEMLRKIDI